MPLASLPFADLVPPLILRLTTTSRTLRSAALLSAGNTRVGHEDKQLR